MLARNTVSVLLTLMLVGAPLALTFFWNDTLLDNWDKGWDVNVLGEPTNDSISCGDEPCVRHELVHPGEPLTEDTNFCTDCLTGEQFLCNDLSHYPLMSDEEWDAWVAEDAIVDKDVDETEPCFE
ncbi:hypothetical protein BGZ99_005019 [Dissophora globulifera]|uniref:Uncharacterized protein n=1 Tax=Dissophora globulifera TaxID=979702 RepID=A0A9P6RKG7_9FUNG|nr:hypothetical protein BGZ99_005019 [Dissophora globulifera]